MMQLRKMEETGLPPLWRSHQNRSDAEAGFTLIELLVVLAILSLLALLVMPYVTNILPKARGDSARIQIERLSGILDLYYLDVGAYPPADAGLDALLTKPADAANWHGPYVRNAQSLKDPWGHPYQYRLPGQHGAYDLFSFAQDGKEGGEDNNADITNWQSESGSAAAAASSPAPAP